MLSFTRRPSSTKFHRGVTEPPPLPVVISVLFIKVSAWWSYRNRSRINIRPFEVSFVPSSWSNTLLLTSDMVVCHLCINSLFFFLLKYLKIYFVSNMNMNWTWFCGDSRLKTWTLFLLGFVVEIGANNNFTSELWQLVMDISWKNWSNGEGPRSSRIQCMKSPRRIFWTSNTTLWTRDGIVFRPHYFIFNVY